MGAERLEILLQNFALHSAQCTIVKIQAALQHGIGVLNKFKFIKEQF